ncbi:MAG TPA: GAF domain-containing protein, partial [Roseiflexaceae bacterium]|nr:GAF domain-containing protein [Roseiflexaceae bacterium]
AYWEEAGDQLVAMAEDALPGYPSFLGQSYQFAALGQHREMYMAGQPLWQSDVASDLKLTPEQKAAYAALNINAWAIAPLIKEGRLHALFAVYFPGVRTWQEHELVLLRDIAERTWAPARRIRIETALRQSEEKYRTLFDSIDEGFCITELVFDQHGAAIDLYFREVNRAFERLTGLSDVVGKSVGHLLPVFEAAWLDIFSRVAATGHPERHESYVHIVDRWYNGYFSPIGDAGSRLVAVVFDDITERKRAEAELRRAAALDAFRVKLNDALHPLTRAEGILMVAAYILGEQLQADRVYYAEAESDGEHVVIPEGYYSSGATVPFPGRFRIADYGTHIYLELRAGRPVVVADIQTKAGSSDAERAAYHAANIAAFIAYPLIKDDRLAAILGVIQAAPRNWTTDEVALVEETAERTWDAVERTRAEADRRASDERFRAVIENSAEGVLLLNAEGHVTYSSPTLSALLGYSAD